MRFLAGGQLGDLIDIYGLTDAEAYRSAWYGVDAINRTIPVKFQIKQSEKEKVLGREYYGRSKETSGWISHGSNEEDEDEELDHKECSPKIVSTLNAVYKKFRKMYGMNEGRHADSCLDFSAHRYCGSSGRIAFS